MSCAILRRHVAHDRSPSPNRRPVLVIATVVGAAYAIGCAVAGIYGLRLAAMTALYLRVRPRGGQWPCNSLSDPADPTPAVTVQLPLYNEGPVAARAIEAAGRLRWPRERFEVQVLDDSDDGGHEHVDAAVAKLRASGVRVHLHRRGHRLGYKAGALAEGTELAGGDLLAILDADFVPRPDFLERTVHHMGPGVAAVQARWSHLNADAGALTRAQALGLDGYFVVEQTARAWGGLALNFNGSAGIWRREAIEDAGGWRANTLTEDVDLSYRAQLADWRIAFLPDVDVPGELPGTPLALKRQQRRWALGTTQCARRLAGAIATSGWGPTRKAHALLSLTNHAVQPVMLMMLLGMGPLLVLRPELHPLLALFALLALNVPSMHALAQRALHAHPEWLRRVARYPLLSALAVGMTLNGTLAVVRGMISDGGTFERTPKSGGRDADEPAPRERADGGLKLASAPRGIARPSAAVAQAVAELSLAGYAAVLLAYAIAVGAWGAAPYLVTCVAGFGWVGGASAQELLTGAGRARWALPGRLTRAGSGPANPAAAPGAR